MSSTKDEVNSCNDAMGFNSPLPYNSLPPIA